MKRRDGKRNRRDGRYTYEGDFERLCVCGRTLGVHDAEAPHGFGDWSLDDRDLPSCDRFSPAPKTKKAQE